ncbi:MAG: hypothetical protein EZS28_016854, partial [Streblomastix strix]
MGWPFQKKQQQGSSAGLISPMDDRRAETHMRHQSTPNQFHKNMLHVASQPQSAFVKVFRLNIEINPLDPYWIIATPKVVPPNAIAAPKALLVGFSGQETSQIEFFAEKPSDEQVLEVRQRVKLVKILVTQIQTHKHNNSTAQPMLSFNQVLADLETQLLQQCRLPHGTLTQIVKRDQIATLKYNLCTFISIYDTIYKVNMTRALMDTTAQVNLLKTQPSPVLLPGLHGRTKPRTEEVDCATGYTIDREQSRGNANRTGSRSRQKTNATNPADCPPLQQIRGQQRPQYPFQYSVQPMQYPIQPVQFLVIPPLNPFLPTVNPPQTQMSEPRLPSNETVREQQGPIQPSQQMEQAAIQTVERPRQSTMSTKCKHNMLIPPIPAYPQLQNSRIPLVPYTTERNQYQRQSKILISPIHKRMEVSDKDDFLDEVMPRITMSQLRPHRNGIEAAQRTCKNRGYYLIRVQNVIQCKHSKWHIKLATQQIFTLRYWRQFWSEADFSL